MTKFIEILLRKMKIKLFLFYIFLILSDISLLYGAADYEGRIQELRTSLVTHNVQGFLVPHHDEYQSEDPSPANKRLEWLTGFTGSAGIAIVTDDEAAIVVDGRYVEQAKQQVPATMSVVMQIREGANLYDYVSWLKEHMRDKTVGYDPKLFLCKDKVALEGVNLRETPNLVDRIRGQSFPLLLGIQLYPEEFSGQPASTKIAQVRGHLRDQEVDATVILDLDSIAWLLNIRGRDLPFTPVILASLLVEREGSIHLVTPPRELGLDIKDYFSSLGVSVWELEDFKSVLKRVKGKKVLVDDTKASVWLVEALIEEEAQIIPGADPSWKLRACKNPVEIKQMELAHRCDGVALCELFAWFDRTVGSETLTEKKVAEKLVEARVGASAKFSEFKGRDFLTTASFPTISAFGPHTAHPHYAFTEDKDRGNAPIKGSSLYLNDSGAQYANGGTTDITRTVGVGVPTEEQRDRFTRVLKGHIAVATAVFPGGTVASVLDPLARQFLREIGLDYNHGTSHGVGSYLAVHESPGSWFAPKANVHLEEGMILSNEPGYYKEGEYGIRIENVMRTIPAEGQDSLTFKTISLAPLDKRLIDVRLLTPAELGWVNDYHHEVFEGLSPYLSPETGTWLRQATSPLEA